MMSSVPQFIDVEDKIAGPLTWKQLGWMMAMGGIVLTLLGILGTGVGIVISIPVVLLFLALAFYKPNGFPMTAFIGQAFMFMFRPKMAVWERPTPMMTSVKPAAPKEVVEEVSTSKTMTPDKLKELARLIDSQGVGR